MEISQKREYMIHFEIIIPNPQLERGNKVESGALTFSYLNVLVSCLRSLACASNAAHWRNKRKDMSVSIYSSQITVF